MGDVPAWKKAILEKKKQKDIDEVKKRKVEEDKLAHLPAWKRSLLLRKQDQDPSGGKSSPPLSRAGFATKRKDALLRDAGTSPSADGAGSRARSDSSSSLEQNMPSPSIARTPSSGGRQFTAAKSPVSPQSLAAESKIPSTSSTDGARTAESGKGANRPRADSGGSDQDSTEKGKVANVKKLLGLFGTADEPDAAVSGAGAKQPGSAERRRTPTTAAAAGGTAFRSPTQSVPSPSSSATAKPASSATAKPATSSSSSPAAVAPKPKAAAASSTSQPAQASTPTKLANLVLVENTGDAAEEEEDEVTNIDDIVMDTQVMAKFTVTPVRVAGVESMPTSPTFKSREPPPALRRRGSCLVHEGVKRMQHRQHSVSFDEVNLAKVITFQRDPHSSDEEEEEEEKEEEVQEQAVEEPDRGPKPSSGLKSVPSIAGKNSDASSGFQAFKPKALSDRTDDSSPAADDVMMPSWRQQVSSISKKTPKSEPEPEPMATESDLKVEDIEDQPALLW